MMKINSRIFSFPPYISTSWNNVIALHMKGDHLTVSLVDGDIIEIPNLPPDLINMIFAAHGAFLEYDMMRESLQHPNKNKIETDSIDFPIRFGFTTMDSMGAMMQHNPEQANSPDIPPEVLQKIAAISKIVGPNDPQPLAKPEPHCNCMYCQITRAITGTTDVPTPTPPSQVTVDEHPVSDEDLTFSEWIIEQTGDKLFTVTNKLDDTQKYNVYLGNPVGCTCGKPNCEHILAVLKS